MTSGEGRTVYLLGAGINKGVMGSFYSRARGSYSLEPPLATNFFQQALQLPLALDHPDDHREQFAALYDYIEWFWKLSVEDLRTGPFDLEACFTLIQQQQKEAERSGNREEYRRLLVIGNQLRLLLAHLLSEFLNLSPFSLSAEEADGVLAFQRLGALIHHEKAAVLTLNYDTLLESVIEVASGHEDTPPSYWETSETGRWVNGEMVPVWSEDRPIYDELLPFALSDYNWKRPLAYGFRFDEVQSNITNRSSTVPGERLYSHPAIELYDVPFLKLHGSLDWFRYTRYREDFSSGLVVDEEKAGQVRLAGRWEPMSMFRPFGLVAGTELPQHDRRILEPMIITPVLYKNLSELPISELWLRARQELARCKRLIVGGLSFAPTDFAIRRLLWEAFADNVLEELVVINPESSVADMAANLTHFKGEVLRYDNLGKFLEGLGLRHPIRGTGRKRYHRMVTSVEWHLPGTGGESAVETVSLGEDAWLETVVVSHSDPENEAPLVYEVSYERLWDGRPEPKTLTVNIDPAVEGPVVVDARHNLADGEVTITCITGTDRPVRGHISIDYYAPLADRYGI